MCPTLVPPAKTISPSKNSLTCDVKTNGDNVPVWPPAPKVTRANPSAP